jgi:hypothetical protein
MANLVYCSLALKALMLADALQRRAPRGWALVILLAPGGELAYFAWVVAPGLLPSGRRARVAAPERLPLDLLRHRLRENPCTENQLALADRLEERGSTGEARGLYQALLHHVPDDKRALWGLAQCHLRDGRIEDAVGVLDRLVSLRRSFADYAAWLRLAEALSACGRHDEALHSLERLVQSAPRIQHQLALAQAQHEAGLREAARATLETALEDYRHAPRFIRREAREPARRASKLLDRLTIAA